MDVISTVDDLTARVNAEMREILAARGMPLYDMMSHHLGWGGDGRDAQGDVAINRVYGVLSLLACRAAGGEEETALPAAAAVELVHNFSEIHDDVQGGKPKRDNRDAVWWVWGPAQAINAGDGMHALARLALFRLVDRGVSPEKTFQGVQLLDQASLKMCEGRFLDLEAQERIDTKVDAYMEMVSSKSGALPSCAMSMGGLVASADDATVDALADCGSNIGIAVQIRADLGELWDERAGASPSPEVMNKKKILPVVYALENADVSVKRRIGDVYFKRVLEPGDVDVVRQVLSELGAKEYCEELMRQYKDRAISALDTQGISANGAAVINAYFETLLS